VALLTLFDSNPVDAPLAERLRPQTWEEFQGQAHFFNPSFLTLIESDKWSGLIFWGPPGTGKTTLAHLIAKKSNRPLHFLSAVQAGVKEIRPILDISRQDRFAGRPSHLLFIDEIHRLNKGQQDVLLPFLEDGSIRFIGATTENPSFELNNAIASRCLILPFKPLDKDPLHKILLKATPSERSIDKEVLDAIVSSSSGDGRRAVNLFEHLLISVEQEKQITMQHWEVFCHSQSLYYDRKSENHYDTISAFIKSVRGSDPDAAIYYLARMLEGGEDPLFIARRLVILSSEDIGNANPQALVLAQSGFQACHVLGMPESRIILAQVTNYLACSEKSNRSYVSIDKAIAEVKKSGPLEIPFHIRNAPTQAMKEWGYGKGYQYPHEKTGAWVKENYLPEAIAKSRFYEPSERGLEKKIQEFLKDRGKV
jgi:putative ATPase